MKGTLVNLQSMYKIEFEKWCFGLIQTGMLKFLQNNLKTLNNILKDNSNATGLLKALLVIIIITVFCLVAIMINCGPVFCHFCALCTKAHWCYIFTVKLQNTYSFFRKSRVHSWTPTGSRNTTGTVEGNSILVKMFQNGQAQYTSVAYEKRF